MLLTPNIARNGTATQRSDYTDHHGGNPDSAWFAIDGNFNTDIGNSDRCAQTLNNQAGSWWKVDPGADPGFDQGGGPDRDRPKTAILGPQFCRILVLGPHFWWSGGGRAPGTPPLDPPL